MRSVIYVESYFNAHAASGAGARGLMQVTDTVVDEWKDERGYRKMPDDLERRISSGRLSNGAALADPEINVHIGCWYLAKMLGRFDDQPEPILVALAR